MRVAGDKRFVVVRDIAEKSMNSLLLLIILKKAAIGGVLGTEGLQPY